MRIVSRFFTNLFLVIHPFTPLSIMKKHLFSIAVLLFSIGLMQAQVTPSSPFIEVTGTAVRQVMADNYVFKVTILPGPQCEVPKKGRDWEKAIKDCQVENEKLIASREAVLEALLGGYKNRISLYTKGVMSNYLHGPGGTASLYACTNYADYLAFTNELYEVTGAYVAEIEYATYSKQAELESELTYQALQVAGEKADKMAAVFGMKVSTVAQIYEEKPVDGTTAWLNLLKTAGGRDERRMFGIDQPDSEGQLTFTRSVYVRFDMAKR
jgi:Protein of unknown function (DUF541)